MSGPQPGCEPWCAREHTPDPASRGSAVCMLEYGGLGSDGEVLLRALLTRVPGSQPGITVRAHRWANDTAGDVRVEADNAPAVRSLTGLLAALGYPDLAAAVYGLAAIAAGQSATARPGDTTTAVPA